MGLRKSIIMTSNDPDTQHFATKHRNRLGHSIEISAAPHFGLDILSVISYGKDWRAGPDAYVFSRNMHKEVRRIFGCWHAFREGYLSPEQLLSATTLMRARMKRYCQKYLTSSDGDVRTRAKRLFGHSLYEAVNRVAQELHILDVFP